MDAFEALNGWEYAKGWEFTEDSRPLGEIREEFGEWSEFVEDALDAWYLDNADTSETCDRVGIGFHEFLELAEEFGMIEPLRGEIGKIVRRPEANPYCFFCAVAKATF